LSKLKSAAQLLKEESGGKEGDSEKDVKKGRGRKV
jgi:hypothetical protein